MSGARVYNKFAMCHIRRIVIVSRNLVVLELEDGDCTHMPGAIKIAKELNPEVKRIECYNPDLDVIYVNDEGVKGGWYSLISTARE